MTACRFVTDVDADGRLVECGRPIVSVWMETRTCEAGHVVAVQTFDRDDEADLDASSTD